MQDEYFEKTGELKQKISAMLKTLDEINKSISINDEYWEEVEKLSKVMKILKEFDWNLEELEHLVIADGVHYRDAI